MDNTLDKTPLRYPGQSIQEKITADFEESSFNVGYVGGAFAGCTILSVVARFVPILGNPWVVAPISLAAFLATLWITRKNILKLKSHRTGLKGEQIVGESLNHNISGPESFVFHDILFDNYNVDHLIVSTRGIFSIETKAVRNDMEKEKQTKIRVFDDYVEINGVRNQDHIAQTERNAKSIVKLLKDLGFSKVPVRGTLLYPGRWVEGDSSKVLVKNSDYFCRYFDGLSPSIDLALAKQIRTALDRHTRALGK